MCCWTCSGRRKLTKDASLSFHSISLAALSPAHKNIVSALFCCPILSSIDISSSSDIQGTDCLSLFQTAPSLTLINPSSSSFIGDICGERRIFIFVGDKTALALLEKHFPLLSSFFPPLPPSYCGSTVGSASGSFHQRSICRAPGRDNSTRAGRRSTSSQSAHNHVPSLQNILSCGTTPTLSAGP